MSYLILRRARAFRAVFGTSGKRTPEQALVLAVLGRFCRVDQSSVTVSPVHRQVDPLATCVAEGRREVFNRIAGYLQLDQDALMRLMNEGKKTED